MGSEESNEQVARRGVDRQGGGTRRGIGGRGESADMAAAEGNEMNIPGAEEGKGTSGDRERGRGAAVGKSTDKAETQGNEMEYTRGGGRGGEGGPQIRQGHEVVQVGNVLDVVPTQVKLLQLAAIHEVLAPPAQL